MKKSKDKNSGITLIALAITILVLLILAGVTVVTLTGDNGLISKTGKAKTEVEKSAFKEEVELILLQAQLGEKLEDLFKSGTVTNNDGIYEISYKNNDFLVSSNYEYIEIVEPVYEGEWTIDKNTLTAYNGDLTAKRGNQEVGEVRIPNYYNGKRVKKISNSIFTNNKEITSLIISEGIEEISDYTFSGCTNLEKWTGLPNTLKKIGFRAFYNCENLEGEYRTPDSLKELSDESFGNCKKITGSIRIPQNMTIVPKGVFQNCTSLNGTLDLPNNITKIREFAFSGCSNLNGELKLPKNLNVIESGAFQICKGFDGNITIPDGVTSIGDFSFFNNNYSGTLKIPNSVENINKWAFVNNSFSRIIIDNTQENSPAIYKDSVNLYNNIEYLR